MPRELLILRHAKSDWNAGIASDFHRPLAKRGKRDAPAIGAWLYREGMVPDHFISSPAVRARDTALKVCKSLDLRKNDIVWDDAVYAAQLADLIDVLKRVPADAHTVLLVGHNPGLEDLIRYLVGRDVDESADAKLLPTAALARLEMPDDWTQLEPGCAALLAVVRPRQLQ